ncbi:MAG: sigma-54-dependent Fis family transcriptional regulator, partial [Muribaculaceae bacterium]|nr:sigma-54-dependent Fis family transcriptional regulator [Muribaculaceae bacterium]
LVDISLSPSVPKLVDPEGPHSLEEKERQAIEAALERNSGRRKVAARELGISERTLYRKIKEYGLDQ